jgi:predicted metal-binding membrane protein
VTHAADATAFGTLVFLWWGMMAVMMLPLTWPWLRALARLATPPAGPSSPLSMTVVPAFAVGYLLVWLAFSVGAASLQLWAARALPGGAVLQGGVLAAAGVYQLTPLKTSCLEHCRSPWAVLLTRWPVRARGALRLGVEHGAFCVGCCWALMLVALGAGAAGLLWMAGLTVLVALEKLTRAGPSLVRWSGVGLLVSALISWARG